MRVGDAGRRQRLAAGQEAELHEHRRRPTTSPPQRRTSSTVAAAVPPVASTSSTTRTRAPARNASEVHLEDGGPVLEVVRRRDGLAGQLALLPHRHEAGPELPGRPARRARTRGPRSRPPCRRAAPRKGSASPSTASVNEAWSASSGVMSLKTMPGFGKSGTSRTLASRRAARSASTVTASSCRDRLRPPPLRCCGVDVTPGAGRSGAAGPPWPRWSRPPAPPWPRPSPRRRRPRRTDAAAAVRDALGEAPVVAALPWRAATRLASACIAGSRSLNPASRAGAMNIDE